MLIVACSHLFHDFFSFDEMERAPDRSNVQKVCVHPSTAANFCTHTYGS